MYASIPGTNNLLLFLAIIILLFLKNWLLFLPPVLRLQPL
ncbi:hypothetical protein AB434_2481 [Heyndrickxia coagulans]|uniref:Uncharacterized protein n=1 Tax=Heyndrickxia coagulans TaxID=1398 RepID=A0AAN0T8N4_HEYCO|nr:hypothetical protein SB48_HM08orf04501 [Heyndrickxia coagulans]AKN54886.1 hypothetical protein AB434_2481 [Heyndrickxia coagulans]KYC63566.1 hypothetical protein B4100_0217 [Heyndrickxia coagulans]KYC90508.1 hypothetical protein B4096_0172 [Heyndrickxia coagulans]